MAVAAGTADPRYKLMTVCGASDGTVTANSGLAPFLECDSCLLLGRERALLDIAVQMGRAGKCAWRDLSEIPK